MSKNRPVAPESVERYLKSTFGDAFDDARGVMMQLARSKRPDEIATERYEFYEKFRPTIPESGHGWGAKGHLDLSLIRKIAANS